MSVVCIVCIVCAVDKKWLVLLRISGLNWPGLVPTAVDMLTVLTVLRSGVSSAALMWIVRVPVRPSRLKAISMSSVRRNVCMRRNRRRVRGDFLASLFRMGGLRFLLRGSRCQEAQATCTEGRLLRQHRQHRLRPCSSVDGCRRGLNLLDWAAVGSTEDRDRYCGRC